MYYQSHQTAKELFPEDTDSFRLNSVNRKDWNDFVKHPDTIRLISSIGDMNIRTLSDAGSSEDFKNTHSPAESFKKSAE